MIGLIRLPDGSEAILSDGGQWEHPNEDIAFDLNQDFRPSDIGPACMPFGVCAIGAAAAKYGAESEYEHEQPQLPEGIIS